MITTQHIEGACIGIVIGFVFAVIIYILISAFEYKPRQRLSMMGFNQPPPPPKYKGDVAASLIRDIFEKDRVAEKLESVDFVESVNQLLCDVMNKINGDLMRTQVVNRKKLRIAIPEPLLTMLKQEIDFLYKTEFTIDNEKRIDYRGIQLIENYQFNITVFHIEWYLWTDERLVESFEIKK